MNDSAYPDLFEEAAQAAARQVVEYASIAGALARAFARRRAISQLERETRDKQAQAALKAQQEAERAATRARWAPANDRDWIGDANLVDTATTWCTAIPYADETSESYDSSALSAVRNCEERLRELHPHAMARYDRLRLDEMEPVEAMRQAAPLFLRRPDVREHPGAARAALGPGGPGHSWVAAMHGPFREEYESYQEALKMLRRGSQILHGMQADAARTGMPTLGEDDQRVALENATSLPPDAIPQVIASSRRPWQQDFPFPISDVLAVAATRSPDQPAAPARTPAITERRIPS